MIKSVYYVNNYYYSKREHFVCLAVDTFRKDSGAEVVSEGINSQAPIEVQNMIMSLYVSCLNF